MISNTILVTNITNFKELIDRASYVIAHNDSKQVILDFIDVDYVPSQIVGAVISISNKVEELGGRVSLINVGPELQEQLTTMNLPSTLFS